VVLDEFHERSVDGDLALSLCAACRAGPRPDLRRAAPMQQADVQVARICDQGWLWQASMARAWARWHHVRAGVRLSHPF